MRKVTGALFICLTVRLFVCQSVFFLSVLLSLFFCAYKFCLFRTSLSLFLCLGFFFVYISVCASFSLPVCMSVFNFFCLFLFYFFSLFLSLYVCASVWSVTFLFVSLCMSVSLNTDRYISLCCVSVCIAEEKASTKRNYSPTSALYPGRQWW